MNERSHTRREIESMLYLASRFGPAWRAVIGAVALAIGVAIMSRGSQAAETSADLCSAGNWNPKLEFQLEKSTYKETLIWLSGWSYALTAVAQADSRAGSPRYCLPLCGRIPSRVLVDFLNAAFKDQTITSEEASDALSFAVPTIYKCEKK